METIKKIKQMIAEGVLRHEDAVKYFPELADSEYERIRKEILDVILSLPISPERTEMFYWLDKQADQKPVEWSDEDEEIYRNILNHYSLIEEPTDINGVPKERYINFIKSLRPQNLSNVERNGKDWKPTEEQMMKDAIDGYIERDIGGQLILGRVNAPAGDEFMLLDSIMFSHIHCGERKNVKIIIKE